MNLLTLSSPLMGEDKGEGVGLMKSEGTERRLGCRPAKKLSQVSDGRMKKHHYAHRYAQLGRGS